MAENPKQPSSLSELEQFVSQGESHTLEFKNH